MREQFTFVCASALVTRCSAVPKCVIGYTNNPTCNTPKMGISAFCLPLYLSNQRCLAVIMTTSVSFPEGSVQMWETCTGIDRHREWSIFEICDCDCDWESTLRNSGQAHKFSVFLSIYRRVWVLIVPVVCWLATRQARPLLGPLQLVPYSILDFCSLSRVACSTTVIHLQTGINLSHYLCCTSSQYADDGCHGSQTICPLTDWELSMFRALHPCHFPDVWCCLAWQPLIPPPSVLYFSNTGLWVSDNQRPRLWPT